MPANSHVEGVSGDPTSLASLYRRWGIALVVSIGCGVLFALFAGDKPPVPIPGEASPLFWIGWGPLTAVAIVGFLASVAPQKERMRWYVGAAAAAAVFAVSSVLVAWDGAGQRAILIALHLPFVSWAAVGASVTLGRANRARHTYAFLVQSMEALVAAAVYLGAGLIFGGLTAGIFAVLGVELPEDMLRVAAAFGIGFIPVLAVASVYDPVAAPARQSPTGLARILRIMAWLLLPVALVVMALYVFWFIPSYFWRPFLERDVLAVYNATIIAILALLAAASSTGAGPQPPRAERILRPAVLSLSTLAILLNIYALVAIISRTIEYGLTPNRQTVLGWNVATLLMFAFMLAKSWSVEADGWTQVFRESLARSMPLAVGWAAWVVLVLPHL